MMVKEYCDCCKKESPDKKGYFISNDWFEVEIKDRTDTPRKYEFTFCPKCTRKLLKIIKQMGEE